MCLSPTKSKARTTGGGPGLCFKERAKLEPGPPEFGPLWKLWLVSFVVFILGHAWFYKLRKTFADVI